MVTASWKDVLRCVIESVFKDRLVVVAPGVAYFLMLGLTPGFAALILLYGMVADPAQVEAQLAQLGTTVPPEALALFSQQIERIAGERTVAGWGAAISVAIALWAGSYATGVIVAALNIAFGTEETRGWVRLTVLRVVLMIGAVVVALIAAAAMTLLPLAVDALPLTGGVEQVLLFLRWPLLLLLGIWGLAMLYRFAPDRERPRFRLLSWGSTIAAVLWVVASSLFSLYVTRFDVYDAMFGTLATIVVLMLWLLITAYAILLGAEVDSALDNVRRGRDCR